MLLIADRGANSAHQRERRRWAALRGWRFEASDPALTEREIANLLDVAAAEDAAEAAEIAGLAELSSWSTND